MKLPPRKKMLTMNTSKLYGWNIVSAILGFIVFCIGVLNLLLIHPVPGIIAVLLSILYIPKFNTLSKKKFGFIVPIYVKILLGIIIIWFSLGVSDLGEMIDDL